MALSKSKPQVAVVGAGIMGLSAAVHLAERFPGLFDITVISDKFSPETVTNKAVMMVSPVNFGNPTKFRTDSVEMREKIMKWTRHSFKHFHTVFRSDENGDAQLCLRSGYGYQYQYTPDPWWKDCVFGFRHVDLMSEEAKMLHVPPDCVDVWAYTTYFFDPHCYLNWMEKKLKLQGGKLLKRKVESLSELDGYDVVINCTGLGSRQLLNDSAVRPSSGQALLVRAPWINHFFWSNTPDGHCQSLYPRPNGPYVLVGGTSELDDWNETPDPEISKRIIKECQTLVPSLAKGEIIDEWVGLRPVRDPVRLDSCESPSGKLLVNNYGHGAHGASLCWGCSVEVGDIIGQWTSKYSVKAKL